MVDQFSAVEPSHGKLPLAHAHQWVIDIVFSSALCVSSCNVVAKNIINILLKYALVFVKSLS